MQDVYGEAKTIEFPGMIARVHSPVLTDQERTQRMKAIEKAAIQLLAGEKNDKL